MTVPVRRNQLKRKNDVIIYWSGNLNWQIEVTNLNLGKNDMAKHTIILAHGVLGFGSAFGLPLPFESPIRYFNGVAQWLQQRFDVVVIEPQVAAIGTINTRAGELTTAISNLPPGGRIDIIAHSMGGLDARLALVSNLDLAKRVTSLVTIGTPHRGSPVADAIFDPLHNLADLIPTTLKKQTGALRDLTTEETTTFNLNTPDVSGVRYFNIAGNAELGAQSFFYELATLLKTKGYGINDGVVTQTSALYENHTHLSDWPVDHAGQIGWSTEILTQEFSIFPGTNTHPAKTAHLARYDQLVTMLLSFPARK